jgi:hypothetical protein
MYGERKAATGAPDSNDAEAYRLVTIRPVAAPEGCLGRDWLVYRIAQGTNVITGYRRGDVQTATADVEKIIVGLNERRVWSKGRQSPPMKPSSSTAAQGALGAQPGTPAEAAPATQPKADGDEEP